MYGLGEIDLSDPVSDDPLNDSLVSWLLPLENNWGGTILYDLCGRNHGTLVSGYTWEASAYGSNSLRLSSPNAYLPDYVFGTAPYSASCWFRLDGVSGTQNMLRSDSGTGGNGNFWIIRTNGATLDWYPCAFSGAITGVGTLTAGRWHHALGTRDSAGNSVLYLDGLSIGSNTGATASAGGSGANTWLGSLSASFESMAGSLTDIRLVGRALSAPEAAALYDQTLRGHPDTLRRLRRVVRAAAAPAGNRRRRVIICGSR